MPIEIKSKNSAVTHQRILDRIERWHKKREQAEKDKCRCMYPHQYRKELKKKGLIK